MFIYPDMLDIHESKFSYYDDGMQPLFKYDENKSYEENISIFMEKYNEGSIYDNFDRCKNYYVMKNIKTIVTLYLDVTLDFVSKINKMRNEVNTLNILFDSEFLGYFSSDDWIPTRMIFKENVTENDKKYIRAKEKAESKRKYLDEFEFNERLKKEVIWNIDKIISIVNLFININNNKYLDLKHYKK